jgi:hypothetical protein
MVEIDLDTLFKDTRVNAAAAVGSGSVLTQYGAGDTVLDLAYNTLGAVVVGIWGTAYLTDVVGAIETRLDSGAWSKEGSSE